MPFKQVVQAPRVQTHCLRRGATLLLAAGDDACLQTIFGEGSGCILEVARGAAGVWIPLRGSLQVHSAGLSRRVHAGEALVTEIDDDAKAVGNADGLWLAVVGGKRAWESVLPDASAQRTRLFPDLHRAGRETRRAAIAVVRADSPLELEATMGVLADGIVRLQAPLHSAITRCPGRTFARKRQVFLRLQRVRNYISAFCYQDIDNEALALMANFSPCYFLRTFKNVYLETPHSYLVDQRLQRARRLLHSSNLAIMEIALACGFENRCVFSRTFHHHFGMTAQEARHMATTLSVTG